jgi:hypothetical protein
VAGIFTVWLTRRRGAALQNLVCHTGTEQIIQRSGGSLCQYAMPAIPRVRHGRAG